MEKPGEFGQPSRAVQRPYFLPRVVGPRRAAQMCLAGKIVGAQEALDWGLVSEVVEKERLQERAGELARDLVASAEVIGPTKKLLSPGEPVTYERHLENELESIAAMASSAGTQAKIARFAERTPA
ncbi:enoyl-CoA hydratase/isomerase family protein [Citricoccus sp. K5]|uniref:enoyl-CoA hydratase/isomerase family protein n=1 Tax=Citricoccus sp. K5 TaxID=2653135 RepID=UPI00210F2CA9|nr:enoyl-CoA hydratase/isomerase family protein [Citricoccus sp. K5]